MQKTVSIKLNKEFKSLYYKGGCTLSSLLVLYYRKNRRGENRLGFTVSKKVGNAVIRNKVRRKIKENYRLREAIICDGYDIVIVARGKAATASYYEIGSALEYVLKKSGLLKN